MAFERRLAYWATALCAIPVLAWLVVFFSTELSVDPDDWASFGSYIGGAITPILAFASFIGLLVTLGLQRSAQTDLATTENDKRYFEHATKDLERAYETLTDQADIPSPRRERLAWLTAARLLLAFRSAKDSISVKSPGLRELLAAEEEHWRRQFYLLFRPHESTSACIYASYFHCLDISDAAQIEERSIRVIYEFFQWPDGRPDPIDSVPKYTLEELQQMKTSMMGVREYVLSMPRFKKPKS
jgi:hypothetical protein